MTPDIFSSFDPSNYNTFSTSPTLFWALLASPMTFPLSTMWMMSPLLKSTLTSTLALIFSLSSRTQAKYISSLPTLISHLFFLIIMMNLLNLSPYSLSMSSQILVSLSLGLPLWMSMIISSMTFLPKYAIAHLLPSSTPPWLSPPLTLVETSSISVRPLTISVRLTANMSAGHIVMGLMGGYSTYLLTQKSYSFFALFPTQLGYFTFELGICFIQAFIFFLLLSLYSNDHPILFSQMKNKKF